MNSPNDDRNGQGLNDVWRMISAFPFDATAHGVAQVVVCYPAALDYIATHPDGRTWAGASSNDLALIHLEGGKNL